MVPVITIDGPSGSGKGTISQLLAQRLGWHFLDSGALYRVLALSAQRKAIAHADVSRLEALGRRLDLSFYAHKVWLDGEDVTDEIRTEACGSVASKIAAIPEVRAALLAWQRNCAKPPGLIADGRDMGTVVFPDARVKIFLTASADERARRRYNQLKEKGLDVNLRQITSEIKERDRRDSSRSAAPLKVPGDALELDTTNLSISVVTDKVWQKVNDILP